MKQTAERQYRLGTTNVSVAFNADSDQPFEIALSQNTDNTYTMFMVNTDRTHLERWVAQIEDLLKEVE